MQQGPHQNGVSGYIQRSSQNPAGKSPIVALRGLGKRKGDKLTPRVIGKGTTSAASPPPQIYQISRGRYQIISPYVYQVGMRLVPNLLVRRREIAGAS